MTGERGSGTVLALGVLGAAVALLLALAPLVAIAVGHQRAAVAADAAALAGADTALGAAPGLPCERARALAAANGARLTSCSQQGTRVAVTVTVVLLGLGVRAVARAGPPADAAPDRRAEGDTGGVYGGRGPRGPRSDSMTHI